VSRQSPGTRGRIYAVAGVVVLYLVIKFISIPGLPCQISDAKECAPSNDTIAFVPQTAAMYAHVTVNSDSRQSELADDLGDQLPDFIAIIQEATGRFRARAGSRSTSRTPSCPGRRTTSPSSRPGAQEDHQLGLHRRGRR
jgi:hypothetical protein